MLNSTHINNASKVFQSEGNFGQRHIHTIPLKFIPKYEKNRSQIIISEHVEKLMGNFPQNAIDASNPTKGNIATRRKKFSSILHVTIGNCEKFLPFIQISKIPILLENSIFFRTFCLKKFT